LADPKKTSVLRIVNNLKQVGNSSNLYIFQPQQAVHSIHNHKSYISSRTYRVVTHHLSKPASATLGSSIPQCKFTPHNATNETLSRSLLATPHNVTSSTFISTTQPILYIATSPPRNASPPSSSTLHIHTTPHTLRWQHLHTPHNLTTSRLQIQQRHPKHTIMEPEQRKNG